MSPSPAELNLLHVLHVGSVIALIAYTFYAFAAPPETRKPVLIGTGIAALLVLLTGIRMWQAQYQFVFMGWVVVKIVCWLGLSGLTGMAYRKREKARMFMTIVAVLALIALVMVYFKPTL